METFWRKRLRDGTTELGTPSMIEGGKASWTRGRQDIVSVDLAYAGTKIRLVSPVAGSESSPWKQFDNITWSVVRGTGTLRSREVRCPAILPYLSTAFDDGWIVISCNAVDGQQVPPNTSEISCTIRSDGSIIVRYIPYQEG